MNISRDLLEVREAYDAYRSHKERRRTELRIELERRIQEEEEAAVKELAQLLHHKFNMGMSKKDLRWATRQYGSPQFSDIWNAVEFQGKEKPATAAKTVDPKTYEFHEGFITFTKGTGDWDWTGVGAERLTFPVRESENTGENTLHWGEGEAGHALFNARNLHAIREVLKEIKE